MEAWCFCGGILLLKKKNYYCGGKQFLRCLLLFICFTFELFRHSKGLIVGFTTAQNSGNRRINHHFDQNFSTFLEHITFFNCSFRFYNYTNCDQLHIKTCSVYTRVLGYVLRGYRAEGRSPEALIDPFLGSYYIQLALRPVCLSRR